jgi:large subunit ribosomal protein L30
MEKEQKKISKKKSDVSSVEDAKKPIKKVLKKESDSKSAPLNADAPTSSVKVAASAKNTAKSKSTIHIKQIASHHGRIEKQVASLKGLGLSRINQVVQREDTPAVRGMINRVKHLVEIIKV